LDETIIQAIINAQNTQVKAVLATIIRTEGSTPRDLGTQMLVMETGQTIGTIGGGTAEKLITKQALALSTAESEASTEIHRLEINQETITAGIAVCGGNMEVLLEPVQGNHFWKIAQDLQMSGKDVVLVTSLANSSIFYFSIIYYITTSSCFISIPRADLRRHRMSSSFK